MPSFFGNTWWVPTFVRKNADPQKAATRRRSLLWCDKTDDVWFVIANNDLRLVNWLSPRDLVRFPLHWFWTRRYGR
jgi:hypothetical protein